MRQNPARRTALLDAAIGVLAEEGSRGLTLRAVDKAAGVPTGTASNYFSNRSQLLGQLMARVQERLAPDPERLARTLEAAPSRKLVTALMGQLMERLRADRAGHLAMLELRLEATRRPELAAELGPFLRAEVRELTDFHVHHQLPGGRTGVFLLYLAMLGLIVNELTVPELLAGHPEEELIEALVNRLLAPESPPV